MTTTFATLSDLVTRYPSEATLLAADETTGLRDDTRLQAAIEDASAEVAGVLQARYTLADLARADADSRRILAIYTMDVALYRVALSFARSTDAIRERRDQALKRLEAIAAGRGGLSFDGDGDGPGGAGGAAASPQTVLVDAPARLFSRARFAAGG